jgi:hypothetical protein
LHFVAVGVIWYWFGARVVGSCCCLDCVDFKLSPKCIEVMVCVVDTSWLLLSLMLLLQLGLVVVVVIFDVIDASIVVLGVSCDIGCC